MANPFFIPAGPSVGERVAQPLTELMRIRQAGTLGEEHNRLMGEDIALRDKTLQETQRGRKQTVPVSRQNFDANAAKVLGMAVDKMDPKGALKWLKQDWDLMAENPEVDKGYVYGHYLQNWPTYRDKIAQRFRDLAMNEDLTPYLKEQYNRLADQVSKDEQGNTLAMFFPTVARERQMENLALAAKFKENEAVSPLGKLLREMNSLPVGDPNREAYRGAIAKQAQSEGLQLTTNADGTFTLTQGPLGAGGGMSKPTTSKVEENLFNIQNNLARLDEIQASYKPQFLELGTKWNALKTAWGEKLKGTKLGEIANAIVGTDMDPADKQLLADYSAFKRDAINNVNLYIKEITGAQMSEKEAGRIRKGMPDPGEGLFDGDSPTEFESKWKSANKSLRAAQARYVMYLKQGLSPELVKKMIKNETAMSLMEVNNRINEKGRELEKAGMRPEAIRAELKKLFFTMEP